jgi:hypothetical protein
MDESNGSGKSRLDRIEEILERHSTIMINIDASIERQVLANEAAHEFFQAEDQRLLTAQILMNGTMQKLVESMATLELRMEETTAKLNALIDTVDGIIRKKPE